MEHRLGWRLGLFLLCLGLGVWGICQGALPRSQPLAITLDGQRQLMAQLYLPTQGTGPFPAVILCHGVSSTKETMAPLAIELARHGMAALAIDQGGFGESYSRPYSEDDNARDARAALAYLRQHPERFDRHRLGIAGHSMGGTTALTLGLEDRELHTTIVWGMQGYAGQTVPTNLLLGGGLYEEFHTPGELRQMLREATSHGSQEFQTMGDFGQGNARRLVVSPTADHLSEPFDPLLISESVRWAEQSFGLPPAERALLFPWYGLGLLLTFVGSLTTGVSLLLRLSRSPSLLRIRWLLPAAAIGGMIAVHLLYQAGSLSAVMGSNLMLFAVALLWLGNYAVRATHFYPTLRLVGLYAVLAWLAYGLVLVVGHLGEWWLNPGHGLSLPGFMLELPLAMLYSRYQELRAGLFSAYSLTLQPGWLLVLLMLPEVLIPGRILLGLTKGAAWFGTWLRQPLQWQWQHGNSRRSLQCLALSLLVLLGILGQRWQSGLISQDSVGVALQIVIQMLLLPGLVMALVMRSPGFQQLEQWWLTVRFRTLVWGTGERASTSDVSDP